MLNVEWDLFLAVKNNPSLLVSFDIFTDAGAGPFFSYINGPWVDAAVTQNKPIIIVTEISTNPIARSLYETVEVDGVEIVKLTGFGKEIHRLEWIHNYRYDPAIKCMVPITSSEELTALTRQSDLDHGL